MKVTITLDHLKRAREARQARKYFCANCPVALAISDVAGKGVTVGLKYGQVHVASLPYGMFDLTGCANDIAHAYDVEELMDPTQKTPESLFPCTFTLPDKESAS